jgi:hypothetical protein
VASTTKNSGKNFADTKNDGKAGDISAPNSDSNAQNGGKSLGTEYQRG